MATKIRPFVQVLFFLIFTVLMFIGKAQIWMGFIFLSIILSAIFGRYYCGWACPINTLIRVINLIKKKLNIGKKEVPKVFKSETIRRLVFILFLVGLAYTIYTIKIGKKFPLPLIIIPLGLITTLLINEKTWHKYLCPWGVLFSLTGKYAKFGLQTKSCSGCQLCMKNCPAEAIEMKDNNAKINKKHCLLCLECETQCPINTIKYTKDVKSDNYKLER